MRPPFYSPTNNWWSRLSPTTESQRLKAEDRMTGRRCSALSADNPHHSGGYCVLRCTSTSAVESPDPCSASVLGLNDSSWQGFGLGGMTALLCKAGMPWRASGQVPTGWVVRWMVVHWIGGPLNWSCVRPAGQDSPIRGVSESTPHCFATKMEMANSSPGS